MLFVFITEIGCDTFITVEVMYLQEFHPIAGRNKIERKIRSKNIEFRLHLRTMLKSIMYINYPLILKSHCRECGISCSDRAEEEIETANDSTGGDFILVGFSERPELELILSLFVLTFYTITLVGNVAIILLSILDTGFHTPMYFFLRNLSVLDLCFTTSIVPQMLVNMWGGNKKISYAGCMVQYWVALALGSTECVLLAVMAIDRSFLVFWFCQLLSTVLNGHGAASMWKPACGPFLL